MKKQENLCVVSAFINEYVLCIKTQSVLHIQASTFNIFQNIPNVEKIDVTSVKSVPPSTTYNLILGDLPLGMNFNELSDGDKTIKFRRNWLEILECLCFLDVTGTGIFLLEPLGFSTSDGVKFEIELNKRGFFVNAYINCPDGILKPEAAIAPIFVLLSRKQTEKLFVAEINNDNQAREIVRAYFSNLDTGDITQGKFINFREYLGFDRLRISQKIERLDSQYKSYKEYSVADISVEINNVKSGEQFQERENSIYIPRAGNSLVVNCLKNAKNHHNYFQVVLDDLALNEYVSSFFKSALGKLVLSKHVTGSTIPMRTKKDIGQATIALPSLDIQKNIVKTQNKLHQLKNSIDKFDEELALNPTSSTSILSQLDGMLEAIGSLTDSDRVRGIVREGETQYIEFKETLSLDVKKQTKEKYLEDASLKTVVAFLNTYGGKLLIGVSDAGQISGLDIEVEKFHKNKDKFLLHWKNLLKDRIGENYYPFISSKLINIDGLHVLFVECEESQSPCYLDGKDFYVRTNPASDKLEGPKLVEYVKHHFK